MEKSQPHQGQNVRIFRELSGLKQEGLADKLGEGWSQKRISQLEQKPIIDREILDQVSAALGVKPEVIERFDNEAAVNFISNTFHENQFAGYTVNNNPIINSDKAVEILERMIREKDELIKELLSKIPNSSK
jgi:transcriptional regulator with XRE-family HTH domain